VSDTCIRHTHAEHANRTWCGRRAIGFTFISIDHAAYSAKAGGSLAACPGCVEQVRIALHPDNINGSPWHVL